MNQNVTYKLLGQYVAYPGAEELEKIAGEENGLTYADLLNGNYAVPASADFVTFQYFRDDPKPRRTSGDPVFDFVMSATELPQRGEVETGAFFPDAEIITADQLAKIYEQEMEACEDPIEKEVLGHMMNTVHTDNGGHYVRMRDGKIKSFEINDAVITGGDNNWKVVARHPLARKLEYIS